jgi:hypothetical protein
MNQKLTEEIAYHILSNVGILPSDFVNSDKSQSLKDKQFLLSEKITFETIEGETKNNSIYGCQISIVNNKDFKLLLADCQQEKNVPEYALLIQLKDSPAFAIYLIFNRLVPDPPESEALIAVSTNNKFWMPCTTYLQGTFLAGMEQLRDVGAGWKKCTNYQEQYQQLLSFIKFHDTYFGNEEEVDYEGQEI